MQNGTCSRFGRIGDGERGENCNAIAREHFVRSYTRPMRGNSTTLFTSLFGGLNCSFRSKS
jgi:hypothetical protein